MYHLVSLLLALTLLTIPNSSQAEPLEEFPAGPGGHEGFFSSISGSLSLMILAGKDSPLSSMGPGMGLNVIAGYGLGRLATIVDVSYEATMGTVDPSDSRHAHDESSFAFLAVGPGLALILDEGLISASWLFHARATGKGVIEGDRLMLDATGRGLRFNVTYLIRTPFRWGIGLGSYVQFLSLTSVSDDTPFSGMSYGFTANFSWF